jgi:5-histidylcysteine sulfoxide synthase
MTSEYITKNIDLNTYHLSSTSSKKDEILNYFIKTYTLFEKLFEIFIDDTVFYKQPEKLRHKIIFYYGHTAVFYINKLILGKQIQNRVNEEFESIFSTGVDEMSWDDLNQSNYIWPNINDVREYRKKVKNIVIEYIKSCQISNKITWECDIWTILMGIEHEKIHFETSSVLHRQLDIKYIKSNSFGKECKEYSSNYPKNSLIDIPSYQIKLGVNKNSHNYYGWDNEYGSYNEIVPSFKASKYLVSNGQFLEFINDNGYENNSYWCDEGIKWKEYNNITKPIFWIKNQNGTYNYRTLTNIIPLPLNWPVETNYLESLAFCKWLSKKTNKNITLPTESMWNSLLKHTKTNPTLDNKKKPNANINLEHYSSSTPVDMFKMGEFYDVIGNVWQWTSTHIDQFNGFEIHPLYDDFSIPTFDNKHNIFKGGSWASTGNLALANSRYAFRKHFYQHAGFRYVSINNINEKNTMIEPNKTIQKKEQAQEKIKKQYINIASKAIQNSINYNKALNLGCNIGYSCIELSKKFDTVIGIDFTTRNILKAQNLKEKNSIKNIEFWQGDSCNLKPHLKNFDLILCTNNICEIYDIKAFVKNIKNRLNHKGIFIINYISNDEDINNSTNNQSNKEIINKIEDIEFILDNIFKKIASNTWINNTK